jgi:hypothetical protein
MLKEYMTMLNLLGEESLRVKAYYPIAHMLKQPVNTGRTAQKPRNSVE